MGAEGEGGSRGGKCETGSQTGLILTARLEVKSFSTSPLVTSHSRCLICRERTLCAGCARERWHEAPTQRKNWPGGPEGFDLGKGHFPHQSLKRKQKTQVTWEPWRRVFDIHTMRTNVCARHFT